MIKKTVNPASKTMWAYAYQILPPQAADHLRTIRTVLDHAHQDAQRDARTWTARVVLEQQITHILVVSDSPEQNQAVNHQLDSTLRDLQARYSVTAPMAVAVGSPTAHDTAALKVDPPTS